MKLIKDCKSRQKNGRCKDRGHYCSFIPTSVLALCPYNPIEKSSKPKKKGKK